MNQNKYYLKENNIYKCLVLSEDGKNSLIEYTQGNLNKCDTIPTNEIFQTLESLLVAMSKGEV
jgi:hypothetical protein